MNNRKIETSKLNEVPIPEHASDPASPDTLPDVNANNDN